MFLTRCEALPRAFIAEAQRRGRAAMFAAHGIIPAVCLRAPAPADASFAGSPTPLTTSDGSEPLRRAFAALSQS
ncbi:hypothetical protein B0H15DRAFT_949667 [Mycena belliarum]|uniref:Uncharacterized protein n=1 Tax=Mycena belliarum TaxID=1033014 RepID=A0AAD6U593_9AGAR|nr:hypothetical protein B0H15DRAFT_949667 [Mycena belliae]